MSTVVLSGSLGTTSEMWEAQAEALRDFDVVRVEHPGHDGAPMEDVRDVRDLALARARRSSTTERFSFVGLSLGGVVGMHVALEAPERLDRLVLAAHIRALRHARDLGRADRARAAPGAWTRSPTRVLPRWFTPAFGDVQRFRAMLALDARGGVRALLRDRCASTTCVGGSARSARRRSRSPARRIRRRRPSTSRRSPPRFPARASSSSPAPRTS